MPSPTVATLVQAMSRIAPPHLAEPWDNTGLLLGDLAHALTGPTLLTIDLTEPVADEALRLKAGAVVAYHPPIFAPLKRLTTDTPRGRALLKLLGANIAVHSPHTALDAAPLGVTEWLLRLIWPEPLMGMAIKPAFAPRPGQDYKVVTFVPNQTPDLIDTIRGHLSNAGLGHIADYTLCSFTTSGTGTFKGDEHANPAVGKAGQFERVAESRLEMVCSAKALPSVLAVLRTHHPYEEPAVDVYKLEPIPDFPIGAGRIIRPPQTLRPSDAAARLKSALAIAHPAGATVQLATRTDSHAPLVAAVPGSGESLLEDAIAQGCTLFITGEMKHHEILGALDKGCSVILAGHTETERGYLPTLSKRLADMGIHAVISEQDRPPLRLA